jgi:uncharacterized protein (DUF2267 family)
MTWPQSSEATISRLPTVFFGHSWDRLPVDEAAQLAAQLPVLIRGIYYEGWDPSRTPLTYHGVAGFLDRMADEASLHGETEASYGASAAAAVLRRHVSAGEIEDVLAALPPALRALLSGETLPTS